MVKRELVFFSAQDSCVENPNGFPKVLQRQVDDWRKSHPEYEPVEVSLSYAKSSYTTLAAVIFEKVQAP
jgi:hypothetical protein